MYVLFSEHSAVTDGDKREIAKRVLEIPHPEMFRVGIPVSSQPLTPRTKFSELLGPESWFIFRALDLSYEWLIEPPEIWPTFESFEVAKRFVHTVKVVNDAAERNVKFYSEYSSILTDNEEQRASLLQAVEKHRHDYPDFRKSTLRK